MPRIPSRIISVALHLLTKAKEDSHTYIQQAMHYSTPHYFLCAMRISLSWFYITYFIIIYLVSTSFLHFAEYLVTTLEV